MQIKIHQNILIYLQNPKTIFVLKNQTSYSLTRHDLTIWKYKNKSIYKNLNLRII
jgi:hypothetical protein